MTSLQNFLRRNKYLVALLSLFFFTRLVNLLLLPIFNDESIYLNWGWIQIQDGQHLYNSLYDGKQPLLLWIFGYTQFLFTDPLYAGRFVSVLTGYFTFLGIYKLADYFFSQKIALFATLLYSILPIFVFYDRQALMESAIGMIGVWSCYYFLKLLEKPKYTDFIALGVLLGLGIFIKSTAYIFLFAVIAIGVFIIGKRKLFKQEALIVALLISIVICFLVDIPLYLQNNFSNVLTLNVRYSYSINELYHDPLKIVSNFTQTINLLFSYLTPVLFAAWLGGIMLVLKGKNRYQKILVAWLIILLSVFVLFTRVPSVRYIEALLPLVTIFCAYTFHRLIDKWKSPSYTLGLLIITLVLPLLLTALLIFSPLHYFTFLNKTTTVANMEYVYGWTSGYGIKEARDYLLNESKKNAINVYVRIDSGNPEDTMFVYLNNIRRKNITMYSVDLAHVCAYPNNKKNPTYFVSRSGIVNASCMRNLKKFYKPDGKEFVGVYKVISS